MSASKEHPKKRHGELTNVGLRAQATAAGLLQLCIELERADLLNRSAVERIKNAIADEITVAAPRAVSCEAYRLDVRKRLDRLFAGEQEVGSADALSFEPSQL